MSFRSLLKQTCSIERDTAGSKDAGGHAALAPAVIASGIRCLRQQLTASQSAEILKNGQIVDADEQIFLLAGTDVTEKDRIIHGSERLEVKLVDTNPAGQGHHVVAYVKSIRT